MDKLRKHISIKLIAVLLVLTFTSSTVSWAYPSGSGGKHTLAAPSLFQLKKAEYQRSIISDIQLQLAISDIADCLFEQGIPFNYLTRTVEDDFEAVFSREKYETINNINLDQIFPLRYLELLLASEGVIPKKDFPDPPERMPKDGTLVIPYIIDEDTPDEKKYHIYVARKDLVSQKKETFADYDWVLSDKYALKVIGENGEDIRAAIMDAAAKTGNVEKVTVSPIINEKVIRFPVGKKVKGVIEGAHVNKVISIRAVIASRVASVAKHFFKARDGFRSAIRESIPAIAAFVAAVWIYSSRGSMTGWAWVAAAAGVYFAGAAMKFFMIGWHVYNEFRHHGFSRENAFNAPITDSEGMRDPVFYSLPDWVRANITVHEWFRSHLWGQSALMPGVTLLAKTLVFDLWSNVERFVYVRGHEVIVPYLLWQKLISNISPKNIVTMKKIIPSFIELKAFPHEDYAHLVYVDFTRLEDLAVDPVELNRQISLVGGNEFNYERKGIDLTPELLFRASHWAIYGASVLAITGILASIVMDRSIQIIVATGLGVSYLLVTARRFYRIFVETYTLLLKSKGTNSDMAIRTPLAAKDNTRFTLFGGLSLGTRRLIRLYRNQYTRLGGLISMMPIISFFSLTPAEERRNDLENYAAEEWRKITDIVPRSHAIVIDYPEAINPEKTLYRGLEYHYFRTNALKTIIRSGIHLVEAKKLIKRAISKIKITENKEAELFMIDLGSVKKAVSFVKKELKNKTTKIPHLSIVGVSFFDSPVIAWIGFIVAISVLGVGIFFLAKRVFSLFSRYPDGLERDSTRPLEDMSHVEYAFGAKVLRATIHLTNRCNLNCVYCGFDSGASEDQEQIPFEGIKKAIQALAAHGVPRVDFSGGEIFLRKDLFDIIKQVENTGLSLGLLTNGTLITEKVAKKLGQTQVHSVTISLDGFNDTHDSFRGKDSFNKAIRGIQNIIKHTNIKVKVMLTLTKTNSKDVARLAKMLSDMGVWRVVVRACDTMGRSKEDYIPTEKEVWQVYRDLLIYSDELKPDFIEWSFTNPYPHLKLWANNPYELLEASRRHMSILANGNVMIDYCSGEILGNLYEDTIEVLMPKISKKIKELNNNLQESSEAKRSLSTKDIMKMSREERLAVGVSHAEVNEYSNYVVDHVGRVSTIARLIGEKLGLSDSLMSFLAAAAETHDGGYIDPVAFEKVLRYFAGEKLTQETRETYYPDLNKFLERIEKGKGSDLTEPEMEAARDIYGHGERAVQDIKVLGIEMPREVELLIKYHQFPGEILNAEESILGELSIGIEEFELLLTVLFTADIFENGNNADKMKWFRNNRPYETFDKTFEFLAKAYGWEKINEKRSLGALKDLLKEQKEELFNVFAEARQDTELLPDDIEFIKTQKGVDFLMRQVSGSELSVCEGYSCTPVVGIATKDLKVMNEEEKRLFKKDIIEKYERFGKQRGDGEGQLKYSAEALEKRTFEVELDPGGKIKGALRFIADKKTDTTEKIRPEKRTIINLLEYDGKKYSATLRERPYAPGHIVIGRQEEGAGQKFESKDQMELIMTMAKTMGEGYEGFFNGVGNSNNTFHAQFFETTTPLWKDPTHIKRLEKHLKGIASLEEEDPATLGKKAYKIWKEYDDVGIKSDIFVHSNGTKVKCYIIPRGTATPDNFLPDPKDYGLFGALEIAGYILHLKSKKARDALIAHPEYYIDALKEMSINDMLPPGEKDYRVKLFDIVEEVLNSREARLIKKANDIIRYLTDEGISLADLPDLSADNLTAQTREQLEKLSDVIGDVGNHLEREVELSVDKEDFADKTKDVDWIRKNLVQLEADSIVSSAIILAKQFKLQGRKLILPIEVDWMPDNDALNGFMGIIGKELPEALESLGLKDSVKIILKKREDPLDKWIDDVFAVIEDPTDLSNVVVMASVSTINGGDFDIADTDKKPFIGNINPEEIMKKVSPNEAYCIVAMKMISIMLELASGKNLIGFDKRKEIGEYLDIRYDKNGRQVYFWPKSKPIDYTDLLKKCKAWKEAVSKA